MAVDPGVGGGMSVWTRIKQLERLVGQETPHQNTRINSQVYWSLYMPDERALLCRVEGLERRLAALLSHFEIRVDLSPHCQQWPTFPDDRATITYEANQP